MNITLFSILKTIKNAKKIFLGVFIGTFVISTVVAFLLPVYYKSSCVFYPLSPKSYDPRMRFSYNMELYGMGDDADRTITLAESGVIGDYIIKKYQLATRYDYDTTDALEALKLHKEYRANLIVEENNKGAIIVSFLDRSPDTAAFIVNDIVKQINDINKSVIIDANLKQFTLYKKWMDEKYQGLDSLSKIMAAINNLKGSAHQDVVSMEMFNTYSKLKEAQTNLETIRDDISTLQIVEQAVPIVKKAKPLRMVIVGIACLSTFLITLLFLLIREEKEFKELME
jgi:hypothetical protein